MANEGLFAKIASIPLIGECSNLLKGQKMGIITIMVREGEEKKTYGKLMEGIYFSFF